MCDKNKLKIITDGTVEAILSVSKNVEKIILFGSQARGDSDIGSDIDILVVVDVPKEQLGEVKREMRNLASDISLEQDEVVSLVISDKREYDTMANTLFYRNVARDGVELYGKAS